ncbi:hypothetical protein P7K49_023429 [Saguinus oedipus]|uniref:Uncharacterized protein n=1 Tax=Saguinus oedipus TaxID=9490 RepID=A0ABQ9ULQ9_SAGOE|nr:hypothetical protein P7K49_023429 [Saguinus oedipus]
MPLPTAPAQITLPRKLLVWLIVHVPFNQMDMPICPSKSEIAGLTGHPDQDADRSLGIFDEDLHPFTQEQLPEEYLKYDPEHKVIFRFANTLFKAVKPTAEFTIVSLQEQLPEEYLKYDPEHKVIFRFVNTLFKAVKLTAEFTIVSLQEQLPEEYLKYDPEHKVIFRFVNTVFKAVKLTAEFTIVSLNNCC